METLLHAVEHSVATILETIAILIIAIGTVEALINITRVLSARATGFERRAVWLDLARWLVAAMTFQLAADIVATSFSPSSDEIWRLGAFALIRTFISYFLDREVDDSRKLQQPHTGQPQGLLKSTA
jgi:uncharacterized membrane protein